MTDQPRRFPDPPAGGWVWWIVGVLLIVVLIMIIFGVGPLDLDLGEEKK